MNFISLRFLSPLAIVLTFVAIPRTLSATALTWDGGGANGNWSTSANWSTDTPPAATGDTLTFAGSLNLNAVNDSVTALATSGTAIGFAPGAASFNLGGNALALGSGGGAGQTIIQQSSSSNQTISANINLSGGNGDRSIVFASGAGSLTLSGNINFGTGNGDWLFPTSTAGTIVLSGSNTGDGKATAALTAGSNVMRAMMRNNVGGTRLVLGSDSALGNAGTGSASAGTANFRGIIANQQLNLGTTGGDRNLSGSSLIINANNITFNGSSNITLANIINHGGNRDFVVSGTGSVVLSGGIFLSGDQTGRQLYVNLSGGGGVTVNGAVADTFHSGGLSAGTGTLRKAGGGTMRLNGSSSHTALTQVDAGTLLVNGLHAPAANSQRYTVAGNATLGGTGTITPFDTTSSLTALSISGTLSPGDPLVNGGLGTLILDGSNSLRGLLALETGAKMQVDLMTDSGGGRHSDMVSILGASGTANDVFFNNTVINFSDPTGILPPGDYTIFTADAADAFNSGAITVGTGLDIYSAKTINRSGNNIVLTLGAATAPVAAPPVPVEVAAAAPEPYQIVLSWAHAYRATSYSIRRRTESGSFTELATVTAPTITYTDTSAQPGTIYYYVIAAANAVGVSGNSAEVAGASYEPRSIGINLKTSGGSGMTSGDLSGAIRLGNWNNLVGPTGFGDMKTITSPLDSTGAVVAGMTVSVTGGTSSGTFLVSPGETGNEASLFNTVFDQFDGSAGVISVSGVPYESYDVYLYMRDDGAARGGSFTINGTTYYVRGGVGNATGGGAGYVSSAATTDSGSSTPQGNYVRFAGLSGRSFTCSFVAFNAGDSVQRLKLPGFQIVSAAPVTTVPPGTPSGLTITATSLSAVTLSWSPADGASEYRIFRSTTAGAFDYNNPLATVGATSPGYSDTTAVAGTTYYYVVRAGNSIGVSADSGLVSTPPPNLASVLAAATLLWPGQSTTITWAIPNAESLTIDDGNGAQANPTTGSLPVTLSGTKTFTFAATNAQGTTTKDVTVTVVPKPATRDALWQWSVPLAGIVSSETNDHPRAFLYIPPGCTRVRGVMIGQHNMLEEPILEHTAVRQGLADAGMAAIWVSPSFDGSFNFTANPDTPVIFQQMMDALAEESGYAELSKVPVVWIGHSAMAEAPYFFAAWDAQHAVATGEPRRCAAAISIKGWYPGKHDATTPTYSNSDLAGVPLMYIEGEYADANGRAGSALGFRNGTEGSVVSFLADVGGGHFDWNDRICEYLGMYLRKIGQYRLPSTAATDGTATLQTINPGTQGWMADRWRKGQSPAASPADVASYTGNSNEAFWYFDQEHAETTHNAYLPAKTTYQLLGYTQNGTIVNQIESHLQVEPAFVPDATGDGLTFKLGTAFLDTVPATSSRLSGWTGVSVGSPIGHSNDGPILINRVCGPVEMLSPDTFRIAFDRVGTNNIYGQTRSRDIVLTAVHPGDSTYVRAVQQAQIRIPLPLTAGAAQTISFPQPEDQLNGVSTLPLTATTTGTATYPGARVDYYVREGAAKVNGDTLEFTTLPPRTKFPAKVTVVATQYGRTIAPLLQTATPVVWTFWIFSNAFEKWQYETFGTQSTGGDGQPKWNALPPEADAGADPDGDGKTNAEEFHAGTDTLDPADLFQANIAPPGSGEGIEISFPAKANRTYAIEYKNDLTDPSWVPLGTFPAEPVDTLIQYTDPAVVSRRFYRVKTPAL